MLELDRISRLEMKGFPPFADCALEFPGGRTRTENGWEGKADVHLLTGPNGTGKTRILAALMAALGNDWPLQDRVREEWETEITFVADGTNLQSTPGLTMLFGRLEEQDSYVWNAKSNRKAASLGQSIEKDDLVVRHPLRGLAGSGLALLADAELSPGAEVRALKAADYLNLSGPAGGETLMQRLLNLRMHVALERDANKPGRHALLLKSLEAAVQEITGQEFRLLVRPGKQIRLMAQWDGLELYFSELPDGVRSLLNWLAGWVVSLNEFFPMSKDPLNETFVGLLDEPENHLHPEWQRRVIPALQKLFKGGQLFIATHSPFVISSLNDGWIHKLSRGSDGKVKIAAAAPAGKGDSWVSAVREVMGVKEWYDVETEVKLADFRKLLDKAYRNDAEAERRMRELGHELMDRSQELANRVGGDIAQFDAAKEASRPRPEEAKPVSNGTRRGKPADMSGLSKATILDGILKIEPLVKTMVAGSDMISKAIGAGPVSAALEAMTVTPARKKPARGTKTKLIR